MSEDTPEHDKKYDELRFVRFRGSYPDDLIGFVSYKEDSVIIYKPLRVEVDTIPEEGRQIVSMQEYLPQNIVEIKEVTIPSEDILFVTPVKKDFIEQYEYACEYFYTDEYSKPKKAKQENFTEAAEKVVSILEAMQAKKDKPVH
jgi:hypothetical protein